MLRDGIVRVRQAVTETGVCYCRCARPFQL
jgi:hypothetical protein